MSDNQTFSSLHNTTFLKFVSLLRINKKSWQKILQLGINIIDILCDKTGFLNSNGEARRALKENSISVNKEKVAETKNIGYSDLIDGSYILLQRGKKNYFIIKAV